MKKFLAAGKAGIAILDLLQALKGNTCQLWVLSTGDLSFRVRSTHCWTPKRD